MKKIILNYLYHQFLKYNYTYQKLTNSFDPEMKYIPKLVKNKRVAIDIGANIGIYTRYLSKIFNKVEAFEPLVKASKYIEKANFKNVNIHNIALSNKKDTYEFYIPIKSDIARYSNSSLEDSIFNKYDNVKKINIETNILDNFHFHQVDFIKIDVEGHEKQVLEGSQETIKKFKPIILIEIEQRHLPKNVSVEDIFKYIKQFEYKGFFINKNQLESIEHFDINRYQTKFLKESKIALSNRNKVKIYINNFFFLPK